MLVFLHREKKGVGSIAPPKEKTSNQTLPPTQMYNTQAWTKGMESNSAKQSQRLDNEVVVAIGNHVTSLETHIATLNETLKGLIDDVKGK